MHCRSGAHGLYSRGRCGYRRKFLLVTCTSGPLLSSLQCDCASVQLARRGVGVTVTLRVLFTIGRASLR
eukprot:3735320-Pyramimonas_sp.AAC.1